MKLTKEAEKIYSETFDRCCMNFIQNVLDWGKTEIKVMKEYGEMECFENLDDFKDFAITSFLHSVEKYHETYDGMHKSLNEAKDTLRDSE